ncbi:TPA: hypothetical protein U8203_003887 [Pseudomonas putida]|nr:hypothetical protein [Pseudomonas putida]HEN8718539.1 hypothetical protein [Pseudomonas putida]
MKRLDLFLGSGFIGCFVFLAFVLILVFVLSKRGGVVSDITSAVTATVAVAAALIAYGQLDESKTSAVKGIYKEYLNKSIEHPEFLAASYPVISPVYDNFKEVGELGARVSFEQYEYYVSFLLLSAEEMIDLISLEDQDGWRASLVSQFKYHALYLASDEWGCKQYDARIYILIEDGVRNYIKDVQDEAGRLNQEIEVRKELKDYRVKCRT